MPRTRSLVFSELKVGMLSVAAIVVAAAVIFMLSGQGGFFWQRYHLKTRFADVGGLKTGAPVRLAGVEVGSVTGIAFVGAQVEVTFEVLRDEQPRITTRSQARLGSVGLLGQSTVDVSAAAGGAPIADWGYVPTGPAPVPFGDVAATANHGLEEVTGLVRDLRNGRGFAGRLLTDDALYLDVQHLIAATTDVVNRLGRDRGTLGAFLNDRTAYDSLTASLDNLRQITATVNAGRGPLGTFLHDDQMAGAIKATAGNLAEITGGVRRGEGSLGKLVTDDALYRRLDAVTAGLNQMIDGLNRGQGTLGQALQNRQMFDNLNAAIAELRALVADVRANPRKFLNMKFSVF